MKRIAGVVATLAVLVAVSVGGLAIAHTKRYGTSVSAERKGKVISGEVRSRKAPCKRRLVKLFRKVSGGKTLAGSTISSSGSFRLSTKGLPAGTYFAKVTRKRIKPRTRRHRHICKPARSADLEVPGRKRPGRP